MCAPEFSPGRIATVGLSVSISLCVCIKWKNIYTILFHHKYDMVVEKQAINARMITTNASTLRRLILFFAKLNVMPLRR